MQSPPPPRNPDAVLRRLEWTVMRRLDGLLHGDYRTLFRGFGLDLADLREYQYGDDVRHIDWNVTARRSGRRQVLAILHAMMTRPPLAPAKAPIWGRSSRARSTSSTGARSCFSSPTSSARPAGSSRCASSRSATR